MTSPSLVVIVGATGVGKSRLGISLAQALHKLPGQVISADSMQVYKGLDIASAKVTEEEAQGVVHHLTSFVDLTEVFQVHNFLDAALPKIASVHSQGDLPLVVGGTFFYVEALLWDNFLSQSDSVKSAKRVAEGSPVCHSDEKQQEASPTVATSTTSTPTTTIHIPTAVVNTSSSPPRKKKLCTSLTATSPPPSPSQFAASVAAWHELQGVDPNMARRLHPHDIRKIRRSLEVFHTTGKRHSEWLEETGGALGLKAQLRFNCIVLWLDCEQSVLDQRLDRRVDEMLERGLVREVEDYYLHWKQSLVNTSLSSSSSSSLPSSIAPSSPRSSTSAVSPSSPCLSSLPRQALSPSCPAICSPSRSSSTIPLSPSTSVWVDGPTGVCQAIGYKEFLPYLKMKFDQQAEEKQVLVSLAECVETLKHATRRYSRKQRRWIVKRFEGRGLTVHRLDTTDVTTWQHTVFEPSLAACKALQTAQVMTPLAQTRRIEPTISEWQKFTCEECAKTLNGSHEWKVHVTSKKHKKRVASAPLRKLVAELNQKTKVAGLFPPQTFACQGN